MLYSGRLLAAFYMLDWAKCKNKALCITILSITILSIAKLSITMNKM